MPSWDRAVFADLDQVSIRIPGEDLMDAAIGNQVLYSMPHIPIVSLAYIERCAGER